MRRMGLLLFPLSILCIPLSAATILILQPHITASASAMTQQPSFLHSHPPTPWIDMSKLSLTRKRRPANLAAKEEDDAFDASDYTDDYYLNYEQNAPQKRQRPPRRRAPLRQNPKSRTINVCPPLKGQVGAPELPTIKTTDPRIIERWLHDNVGDYGGDGYSILGFDSETIAKPPWKPERASLPDGPATVQLSTPSSCIIIHLSRCGDGSAACAPEILRDVINNPKIIKVGVGIDDDALEMYRWSKESVVDNQQFWEMTSRFDLGCVLPGKNPGRRSGLGELAREILGVEMNKSRRLAMSNWGSRRLSLEQISYASRDAWVSAAIMQKLQQVGRGNTFQPHELIQMDFLKAQLDMSTMDKRAKARRAAKLELKDILERQKMFEDELEKKEDFEDARKEELYEILDLNRPDQPPTFDEDIFSLPFIGGGS